MAQSNGFATATRPPSRVPEFDGDFLKTMFRRQQILANTHRESNHYDFSVGSDEPSTSTDEKHVPNSDWKTSVDSSRLDLCLGGWLASLRSILVF